jgi:hypothetical protein
MYAPKLIATAESRLAQQFAHLFPQGFTRYPAPESIERAAHLEEAYDREKKVQLRALDDDDRRFILNEQLLSQIDYGYFAARYVHVNKGGATLEPLYPLWESQRLILASIARVEQSRFDEGHPDGILFNVLKARQLGCSTLVQSLIAHRVVTQRNIRAMIGSDTPDNTGSDGLFGMLELVVESLPWWLVPPIKFHTKDKHIHFDNGSRVRTESGKSMKGGLTEKGGSKGQMGRSKTYSVVHLSELSTWEHAEQIDDSLMPAIPRQPRTLMGLESTAKGRANWWHRHWEASVRGRTRHVPIFIPWYAEPAKYWLPAPGSWVPAVDTLHFATRATLEGPKYLHASVHLTREQLYWYEQTKLEFLEKGALYKFLEEYCATPEEAFQYSGRGIFPLAVQERIKAQAKPVMGVLEVKARAELAQIQADEKAEAGGVRG